MEWVPVIAGCPYYPGIKKTIRERKEGKTKIPLTSRKTRIYD